MSANRSAATLSVKQLRAMNMVDREEPEVLAEVEAIRPKVRADCVSGPRPCIFVSCKHNLYLDVSEIGSIKFNFQDRELHELEETCALDVADRGGITLEVTGSLMALTRERVRQIEERCATKLRGEFDAELQPHPPAPVDDRPHMLTPERRAQLKAAKKKYRQGTGRKTTNESRRNYNKKYMRDLRARKTTS